MRFLYLNMILKQKRLFLRLFYMYICVFNCIECRIFSYLYFLFEVIYHLCIFLVAPYASVTIIAIFIIIYKLYFLSPFLKNITTKKSFFICLNRKNHLFLYSGLNYNLFGSVLIFFYLNYFGIKITKFFFRF
jgi:hypothetical protein